MSKKRLEEIRKLLVNLYNAADVDEEMKHYIFNGLKIERLIQQAERVEELEEKIADYAYEIGKRKRALNKKNEQNKRYREALEFYADEEHYKEKLISEAQYDADGICISNDEYAPPIIYFDSGEIARQALEGLVHESKEIV